MMEHDPHTLQRLRRAFRARPLAEDPLADPPSADTLWAVATGEASEAAALEVAEAIARSPEVAMQWRATVALVEAASESVPVASSKTAQAGTVLEAPRASWWGWGLAVAAALLLALALRPSTPSTRHLDDPGQLRAPPTAALVPMPAVGARVHEPLILRWSGHPPGARFDVVVQDQELQTIAERIGLPTPTFTVPAPALAQRSGTRVFWRVTTIDEDGQRWVSPTFWVEVTPAP